jgi:hypothetical protein
MEIGNSTNLGIGNNTDIGISNSTNNNEKTEIVIDKSIDMSTEGNNSEDHSTNNQMDTIDKSPNNKLNPNQFTGDHLYRWWKRKQL